MLFDRAQALQWKLLGGFGIRCQDPALTTPLGLDRQRRLPWERALLLALPAYSQFPVSSHFRRTHAPLVVTLPVYSRAARRSRGIHHAQPGLVAVLSHALHGLVVCLGVGGRSPGFTGRER